MTDVESPADTMRRAAKLMRERAAEAEREGYGSWTPGKPWCPTWTYTVARHVERNLDVECTDHPEGGGEPECNRWGRYAGYHISGMHPGVAVALAGWLEFEAVNAPEIGEVVFRGGRSVHALAVAAAYLGEQSILGEPA